jgi:uroporphyrin-III C-methyltransferase
MKPEHVEYPSSPTSGPHIDTTEAAKPMVSEPKVASNASTTGTRPWLWMPIGLVALVGAAGSGLMWSKLSHIQEQLARQSADTGSQAVEARVVAKQAEELARETAARLALTDAKLSDVAMQRSQMDELMQSLSRTRDDNMVIDIEAGLRMAVQQAQLTGSVAPLLAALNAADQRLGKAPQTRLQAVRHAIARDVERIKATTVADTPSLLLKLDELVHAVDTLPLLNAVGGAPKEKVIQPQAVGWVRAISMSWWEQVLRDVWAHVGDLVRVSRIDQPEAVLLAPEQSYFVRENLKLRLLNVRLGLLARHLDTVQSDMQQSVQDLTRYFDLDTRQGQATLVLAKDVIAQTQHVELPRVDATLTALTTAAGH